MLSVPTVESYYARKLHLNFGHFSYSLHHKMTVYGICHSIGTSWSIASETNLTYDQHKILIRFSNVRSTYLLVEMKMDATLFYII